MPLVSAAAIADASTIEFTGTDFFTAGYTPVVSFGGVAADTVVVDSAIKVTATYSKGVPVVSAATTPILSFKKSQTISTTDIASSTVSNRRRLATSSTQELEHIATNTVTLTNALDITGSSNGLSCSFAGGCLLEINAKGLSTLLKGDPANSYITVCDNKCPFSDSDSTADISKCKLPPISTTYSNANFKIAEPSDDLNSGVYFGTYQNNTKAFDNNLMSNPGTSTAPCAIGMSFKAGHVGLIS